MNEIVFPAAILQPPFFDLTADDAVNYGAHRRRDRPRDQPRLRRPGPPVRRRRQPARLVDAPTTRPLRGSAPTGSAQQYDAFSPLAGHARQRQAHPGREHRRPERPRAWPTRPTSMSLDGKPAPVIDGLTGDQRFFMGLAQVWRTQDPRRGAAPAAPHRPALAGQVPRQRHAAPTMPAFYEAFGVKQGDKCTCRPSSASPSGSPRPGPLPDGGACCRGAGPYPADSPHR